MFDKRKNTKKQEESKNTKDITISEKEEHEIRFTSGKTIYVESLLDGRWVGRYWNASGRINIPSERWSEDAFGIEINGQLLSTGWKFLSASEVKETERGARHFVVELKNNIRPISLKLHTLLDGTPVLTRWIEITNLSEESLALTAVSPWSGRLWSKGRFIDQAFSLGYFTKSDWAYEGWFDWKPLESGTTRVKCDKGQGHDDPFFIVRNEAKGEQFICHLAWSANWQMEFEKKDSPPTSAGLLFKIGPSAINPLRVVSPGETIKTPSVHLGHVEGNFDTAVRAMHDHLRRSVLSIRKPDRSCLIQLLVPGDQGYLTTQPEDDKTREFNESNIFKAIDVTAAIGAELFTLDAWWWDVSGDWLPSASRFPNGLKPVADYVHEKGLLFGLYAEVEGGRGNISESKIAKEHPDWIVGPKDIFNLTIPECAEWVESEICRMVEEYELDLFRLDYNPGFTYQGAETPRDGFWENNYWRYYEACYRIYERIQKKYPGLILQQCAAGGARNDLGIASRFHETYLTDGLWMPHVLQVYSGQSLALPPEILVIAIGAPGYKGSLDTHLRCTFSLSTPLIAFGPSPSVAELTPQVRERYLHYVKIYKEFIRPLLPVCKIYHHAPVNSRGGVTSSGWFAMEYAAPDHTKGWATIVRIGETESDTYLFKPRGLDPGKTYQVRFDSMDTTAIIDGWQLVKDGLATGREAVLSSELLLFEAQ